MWFWHLLPIHNYDHFHELLGSNDNGRIIDHGGKEIAVIVKTSWRVLKFFDDETYLQATQSFLSTKVRIHDDERIPLVNN